MKNVNVVMLLLVVLLLIPFNVVYAHGVNISYKANIEYEISANYDTGQPLSEAQVTIYSPQNPSEPWYKGISDSKGKISVKLDSSQKGMWLVQFRKGGHGANINIPVGEDKALEGTTGYSKIQMIIMSICILWGFIGTTLYFKARR